MGIQNGTRNFRTSENFRRPVADPPKTQNTTGNWAFFTQFRPISEYIQEISSRWKFKNALKIREFPEFLEFAEIFPTPAKIGEPWVAEIRLHIVYFWLKSHAFLTMRLRIYIRWEFKMALKICGPPATFGALSKVIRKLRIRLEIGHFLTNIDPF